MSYLLSMHGDFEWILPFQIKWFLSFFLVSNSSVFWLQMSEGGEWRQSGLEALVPPESSSSDSAPDDCPHGECGLNVAPFSSFSNCWKFDFLMQVFSIFNISNKFLTKTFQIWHICFPFALYEGCTPLSLFFFGFSDLENNNFYQ